MLDSMGKKANEKPCSTIDTLIGVNTEITGDIVFSGGLRIDGKVKGNITSQGADNSTLVLSENAEVTGDVTAPHLIINGFINGNVVSSGRIEMQSRASISGNVSYRVIEMALGAGINGNLSREDQGDGKSKPKLKAVAGTEAESNES
jgi:cytoskeletal protein CcmA (bactofilin family)